MLVDLENPRNRLIALAIVNITVLIIFRYWAMNADSLEMMRQGLASG
tara:strand:- start:4879 stop:5019 length:141 start_codon:yes stop_codon:yes gene_type:complete